MNQFYPTLFFEEKINTKDKLKNNVTSFKNCNQK